MSAPSTLVTPQVPSDRASCTPAKSALSFRLGEVRHALHRTMENNAHCRHYGSRTERTGQKPRTVGLYVYSEPRERSLEEAADETPRVVQIEMTWRPDGSERLLIWGRIGERLTIPRSPKRDTRYRAATAKERTGVQYGGPPNSYAAPHRSKRTQNQ